MKNRFCLAVLILAALSGPVPAADLTKIDRTIAKEPAYRTNSPRYCLLVFGPEAKTRVWLVQDGDVFYVDRNGNGDLTEPEDRMVKNTHWVATIPVAGTGPKVPELDVCHGRNGLLIYLRDKKYCAFAEDVRLAEQREKAPVVHFQGRLSFTLGEQTKLKREEGRLCVCLRIPGVNTLTQVVVDSVRRDVFPVAELEFPKKNGSGPPVKLKVSLKTRRC